MNEYSPLKSVWWTHEIAMMRAGQQVVPKQVHFIISDYCNQDCHFCAYRMSKGFTTEQFADDQGRKNPHRWMPTEKALEILTDFAELGVRAVQFTGGGEPTAHPDHMRIFSYAQSLGMRTALVTNGIVLRDEAKSVYPKMDWIRVSVDAGEEGTYSSVRNTNPKEFGKALSNIKKISGWIDPAKTTLGAGYVVTVENWREICKAADLFRDAGAHNMRITAVFSTDGLDYYPDDDLDLIEGEIGRAVLKHNEFIVNLFGQREDDLLQMSPDYQFCGYQQMCTYIGADLKVYRCCSTAYTKHGEVGDLSDTTFAEWFSSKMKHDLYRNFDARSCRICQFNDKNRAINYMMEKPKHVEFV